MNKFGSNYDLHRIAESMERIADAFEKLNTRYDDENAFWSKIDFEKRYGGRSPSAENAEGL